MATFRRSTVPGATYFFTVNTYQRQKVLTAAPFYQALKQSLRTVRETRPFTIEAFVLLPDHLHCLWTLPENDADYAVRWNIIKRGVSQQTRDLLTAPLTRSRQQRGELGLWQRRFWEHRIRDERDFEKHVDYIHWNPVKHGYVKRVKDWPYSSFHRFVDRGLYPPDWASHSTENEHLEDGDFGEMD
ncbi:MAG TPA: transposase [Burkholderiales bacterium]|nr:transposase [Burkholderiales bacterium]